MAQTNGQISTKCIGTYFVVCFLLIWEFQETTSALDTPMVIEHMYIQSDIKFRYAQTQVMFQVMNPSDKSQNVKFDIKISPSSTGDHQSGGFISLAKLVMDNITHEAVIHTIHEARNKFDMYGNRFMSRRRSSFNMESCIFITSKNRDLSDFELILKIAPRKRGNVTIVYEELAAARIRGNYLQYTHKIFTKPQQKQMLEVRNFSVILNIEKQDEPNNQRIYVTNHTFCATYVFSFKEKVSILWSPNKTELSSLISKSVLGELKLEFDLLLDSLDKQIAASEGYFTHFAGKETWTLEKSERFLLHIVFVLDISGSMVENRLKQLKDGMKAILDDLKSVNLTRGVSNHEDSSTDFLDIITFSNTIQEWNPMEPNVSPFPADSSYKNSARLFIDNLTAGGSTNIYGALKRAITKIQFIQKNPKPDTQNFTSIIFFLTDGEPTSGLTNRTEILRRLRELNKHSRIPIFLLAFGRDADRPLCDEISRDHYGFTRQIFEMRNASSLMRGFYHDIIAITLNNITIKNCQLKNDPGLTEAAHETFAVLFNEILSNASEQNYHKDIGQSNQYEREENKIKISNLTTKDKVRSQGRNKTREVCDTIYAGSTFQEQFYTFLETTVLTRDFIKSRMECPHKLRHYNGGNESVAVGLTRIALHQKFITPCTGLVT